MESNKDKLVLNTVGWKRVKHFSGRAVMSLGIAQVVFGLLVIGAQIVILALYNIFFNSISQGIWCGGAFIFCGAFAIVAGKRRTLPWVIVHLVFCILVCFFCAAVMGLSALNAAYEFGSPYRYIYPCSHSTDGTGSYYPGNYYPPGHGDDGLEHTGPVGTSYGSGNYYSGGYGTGGDDYWNAYYQMPPQPCYGKYVLDTMWVVQFSMNLLMMLLGLVYTVVVIVSATLSCAPLCCNPEDNEEYKKQTCMKEPLAENSSRNQNAYLSFPEQAPAYMEHEKLDLSNDPVHI
jgi:hypothetical protein